MATNMVICGVGGQGIGLMGEVLCETLIRANQQVMSAETHGVAQRGGTVSCWIRFGRGVRTPKVGPGEADYVFSLERLEALRFAEQMLRPGGVLAYYDCVQQPQPVRAQGAFYPSTEDVSALGIRRGIRVERILVAGLPDEKMQNVALLGRIAALGIVAGVTTSTVRQVLEEMLPLKIRELNLQVFDRASLDDASGGFQGDETHGVHPGHSFDKGSSQTVGLHSFRVIATS